MDDRQCGEPVPRVPSRSRSIFQGLDQVTNSTLLITQYPVSGTGVPAWFLREIYFSRRLKSPHVTQVQDVVLSPPRLFLIQEATICSLYDLLTLKKDVLTSTYIRKIAYNLLEAVQFMHDSGVIHMGLSPHIVLIGSEDRVRIEGFARARLQGVQGNSPLDCYSAPEAGQGTPTEAADVWSLGCILLELAAKQPLFNSVENREKLYRAAQSESGLLSLQTVLPTASPALHSLLLDMLQWSAVTRISVQSALQHPYFES